MTEAPRFPVEYAFTIRVLDLYTQLISSSSASDLGGKLLYVRQLDEDGRALVTAGNIAGAASLSASASVDDAKQAMRDGILDFLVTSLDEALRILKNEIRKHTPVAVCVATSPGELEIQMKERGVLPDLQAPFEQGLQADSQKPAARDSLVLWSVREAPARWMPRLDAAAIDCLGRGDFAMQRWLRLSPRYLGRLARGTRAVYADRQFVHQFSEQARLLAQTADLRLEIWHGGEREEILFPLGTSDAEAAKPS